MRLYYFTSERFGLEAIRDSRIKLARINELNDPFEFMGLALDRKGRKDLNHWKNTMNDLYGMISMSSDWQHPLLWGHYADKHKGLCLGFDVPNNETFKKVEYQAERPTLKEIGRNNLTELNVSDMQGLLFKKFKAWDYESEYRAFSKLDEKDPVSDFYFLPFSETLKLAQVIVGGRSSVTRERLGLVLGSRVSTTASFKSRAGFRKFEVVENLWAKA